MIDQTFSAKQNQLEEKVWNFVFTIGSKIIQALEIFLWFDCHFLLTYAEINSTVCSKTFRAFAIVLAIFLCFD